MKRQDLMRPKHQLQCSLIFLFCSIIQMSFGQTDTGGSTNTTTIQTHRLPEYPPEYPGGIAAALQFIDKHIKYPEEAKRDNLEGVVFIMFTVQEDGAVTDIRVKKGIRPDVDSAVVEAVRLLPNWKPAKDRGQNVPEIVTLPIRFPR